MKFLLCGVLLSCQATSCEGAAEDSVFLLRPTHGKKRQLPIGAKARFGSHEYWHNGCQDIIFSPDGKLLATIALNAASNAQYITIWQVGVRDEKCRISVGRSSIHDIAFVPHSSALAFQANGIHIYDMVTKRPRHILEETVNKDFRGIAISTNGKVLASVGDGNNLHFWSLQSMKLQCKFSTATKGDVSIAFFPNELQLFAAGSSTDVIELWDVGGHKRIAKYRVPDKWGVRSFAVSANGKRLAVGCEKTQCVIVFDVHSGKEVMRLAIGNGTLAQDVETSRPGGVDTVTFSSDGESIAASNGRCHVWNLATGTRSMIGDGPPAVCACRFSPTEELLALAGSCGLVQFHQKTKSGRLRLQGRIREPILGADFSLEENHVALVSESQFAIWDWRSGRILIRDSGIRGDRYPTGQARRTITFAPNGSLAVGAESILIQKQLSSKRSRTIAKSGNLLALAYSTASELFVVEERHEEKVREAVLSHWGPKNTLRPLTTSLAKMKAVDAFASFSVDGQLVAIQVGRRCYMLFKTNSGKCIHRLEGQIVKESSSLSATPMCLSSDGRVIARVRAVPGNRNADFFGLGLDEARVELWEWATKEVRAEFRSESMLTSIAFSPDGRILAAGDIKGNLHIWDCSRREQIRNTRVHNAEITCVRFSRSGRHLVTGSRDTTALVWDVKRLCRRSLQCCTSRNATSKQLNDWWTSLAEPNAQLADSASWRMTLSGNSVSFLKNRLQPACEVSPSNIRRWIIDLDSKHFKVRKKAMHELSRARFQAHEQLERVLKRTQSPEVRQRASVLLARLQLYLESSTVLREERAIEFLERSATSSASMLLKRLSNGAPTARLTKSAIEALGRLQHRTGK